eukprot:TRINITY_DN1104_c0_g4_i2.p3 TRINITY_DN1104_c0_g4~~TRINITY_DN1104_c0_g4_i2.p3  ORF type:complete len:108 (+),score=26.68 TRINITY_DN1104_c0_g4_i2:101-424(+)
MLNMPLMMLSGFFVNLDDVVPVLWPFQWISCLKYTFNIMLRTEFERNGDLAFEMKENNNVVSYSTDDLLDLVSVDLSFGVAFGCLAALYVGFLILALLGLMFTTKRV